MAAIQLRGTVVSMDVFKGKSKKDQKPFTIHTCYVVNGGGKPEPLKVSGDECPYKPGQKIDIPVRIGIFNGDYSLYPVEG